MQLEEDELVNHPLRGLVFFQYRFDFVCIATAYISIRIFKNASTQVMLP